MARIAIAITKVMLLTTQELIAPLPVDIRPAQMSDIYPMLSLHREAFAD